MNGRIKIQKSCQPVRVVWVDSGRGAGRGYKEQYVRGWSVSTGDCFKPGSTGALRAEHTALELFQLAALLVGTEQEALRLVEESVSDVDMDPCAEHSTADAVARQKLTERALAWLSERDPQSFRPGEDLQVNSCVDTDDMEAAGLSSAKLAQLLEGARRQELRAWLDQLPLSHRAIFVQRAVLGRDSRATADAMRQAAGSEGWTSDAVSQTFRSALCSLANQLAHSATGVSA
jgi:DNA-directed RNA polymerase specialized sigma24 family protein